VLRREYWPITAIAAASVLTGRRSSAKHREQAAGPRTLGSSRSLTKLARFTVGLAMVPVVAEWVRERPALDPVRFTALRLLADGAYGTGVLASCLRQRTLAPLLPRLRERRPSRPTPPPAPPG
jgi:hypothetical protein